MFKQITMIDSHIPVVFWKLFLHVERLDFWTIIVWCIAPKSGVDIVSMPYQDLAGVISCCILLTRWCMNLARIILELLLQFFLYETADGKLKIKWVFNWNNSDIKITISQNFVDNKCLIVKMVSLLHPQSDIFWSDIFCVSQCYKFRISANSFRSWIVSALE